MLLGALAFAVTVGLYQTAATESPSAATSGEAESPEGARTGNEDSGWFGIAGAMNYHPHLDESEQMVNREINGVFGRALPNWRKPETFKDWSENWKLWDPYLGAGKDIASRWSWQIAVGAGYGVIPNEKTYHPLGTPLKISVDFERADIFLETGVNYYPWDKPAYNADPPRSRRVWDSIRATRPYFSLLGGYTWQHAAGDASARIPLAGRVLHIKQLDEYNLFYVFPRVCLETPISARDFIGVTAGYLAFDSHAPEFNAVAIGVYVKRQF